MNGETLSTGEHQILDLIYRNGPMANIEISQASELSPSTVSALLKKLIAAKIIQEIDSRHFIKVQQDSSRRKKTFTINPSFGYAISAEVDYDRITISRIRFDLTPIASRSVEIPSTDYESVRQTLRTELITERNKGGDGCRGIGFSLPGHVDVASLVSVRNTRMKGWQDVSFTEFQDLCSTVIIENLANAKAIGEGMAGDGRNLGDFLFLNIGNGTGMGIFIRGELYRGFRYTAGEAGHVIVDEESENICTCGNRGCLESFVSNKAIQAQFLRMQKNDVDSDLFHDPDFSSTTSSYSLLARYYEKGEKLAYQIVDEVAHRTGLACASFLHLFAPERIFIGGAITILGKEFLEMVRQSIRRYHLPWQGPVNIAYPADNAHSAAQGLAYRVFRESLGASR